MLSPAFRVIAFRRAQNGRQSRPARQIQDSMIVLKIELMTLAQNVNASRDHAFTPGKKNSDQLCFGVFPNRFGEQRRKLCDQGDTSRGSGCIVDLF